MTRYLIIERTRQGWRIKDDATGNTMHYVGYSIINAEKTFRRDFNLRGKHFTKIFI
jgi:hypothetical protein